MKKVVIMTARAGYPNGFGASSILRKYASGFLKNGFNTSILLLRPSEQREKNTMVNTQSKGLHNNVEFEYLCGTVYTHPNVIVRQWLYLIGVFNGIKYLFKNRKIIDRLFFYSPDYFISTLMIQIVCSLLGIKCIGIKTESSFSDTQRTKSKIWKIKERYIYNLFSSMIVISTYLREQMLGFFKNKNINVLPIIVDEGMYEGIKLFPKDKTLIYVGTLNYRQELHQLLDAFSIAHKQHKDWKLKIVGRFISEELEKEIKGKDRDLNLEIDWTGAIESNEIPGIIGKGGIMLLPRIDAEYSKAGFPIKLGEYLLSGSPTVVTNTGDIGRYLEDNQNAFVVKPNDTEAFAQKIIDVIENYEKALIVGRNGREFAIKNFGAEEMCKKMLDL
ncbi:hypothetical protein COM89_04275 [Bacillus thuringiensis]|uniref:glycosyltransferase family 4 protein n=1 Tax=Bacillus thuringiensis TaxID=1428 RepID=UPI000BEBCDCF|nr:glycosyltransferase [Bacillus thuringiensis]PEB76739.1 hypothetical protein COM89_04275 [Bacillus thuringiensis]